MITLRLDNRFVMIEGASLKVKRVLDKVCSYKVEGHVFAPAFKNGYWDGREHLLVRNAARGLHAPRGMAIDIAKKLKELGEEYQVKNESEVRGEKLGLFWNPEIEHRDYQKDAINALCSGQIPGCGILKMPIRSGKTKTAAGIIKRIDRPTLFIAPSVSLLYQAKASLEECFPNETIGIIGDGQNEQSRITVATIHTLAQWRAQKNAAWKELMVSYDLVIFDEAHHIRGEGGWHNVMRDLDARYKIGLSATAYLDDQAELGKGIIWLKACCGPIRYEVKAKRLVDAGYLMKQKIHMIRITQPDQRGKKWSATLRRRCIIENETRNLRIAQEAKRYADQGLKIAIIARFHDHIGAIVEKLEDVGLEYRVVTGKDAHEQRVAVVEEFEAGEFPVMIGSVIGEGVDIPSIEVVINAEGGKDIKSTIQRQRNLTVSEGKTTAILVDFMDESNQIFEKHSKARLKVYRDEPAFEVAEITS